MLPKSRLTKLIQATAVLHLAPDDPDDPGSKVHCIVKGKVVPQEYPWAVLNTCLWVGSKPCDGCICARPTDIEEVIDTCRTSSGDVK